MTWTLVFNLVVLPIALVLSYRNLFRTRKLLIENRAQFGTLRETIAQWKALARDLRIDPNLLNREALGITSFQVAQMQDGKLLLSALIRCEGESEERSVVAVAEVNSHPSTPFAHRINIAIDKEAELSTLPAHVRTSLDDLFLTSVRSISISREAGKFDPNRN